MYLATAAPLAIAILSAGFITSAIGYWTPTMAIGITLLAVGAGLLSTLQIQSPAAQWILYQVLYASGGGLLFQQTYTAVQVLLPAESVATALVCLSFTQQLGAITGLAVAQNLFLSLLATRLTAIVPGLDPRSVVEQGAVELLAQIPDEYKAQAYDAYMNSIVNVFYLGTVLACLTVCALGIEWRSVNGEKEKGESERLLEGQGADYGGASGT
jgi:fucose permease